MMAAQPKPPPGRKPDIGLSKNQISERNVERPIELAEAGHRARQLSALGLI
jgi:hypothetical protein